MTRRIGVDTNLWIRALLCGPVTLPVLEAWRAGKFVSSSASSFSMSWKPSLSARA
jgi:hypothetical protein